MAKDYDWRDDAIKSVHLAWAAIREKGVRRNEFAPRYPHELDQNMLGSVPNAQLDCVNRPMFKPPIR